MTCKKVLIEQGADIVPRTCPQCGLGKCTGKPRKSDAPTAADAIDLIRKLSYREMMLLAGKVSTHIALPLTVSPGDIARAFLED